MHQVLNSKIEDCDSLTKLGISASSVYPIDAYSIPVLPSSLRHKFFGLLTKITFGSMAMIGNA